MANEGLKKDLDKKQVGIIVALFVVLLVVLYVFVLSGGGEEPADLGAVPTTETTPTPAESSDPSETPDPEASPDPGDDPNDPPTNVSRDPFEPPPGAVDESGNPFAGVQPEPTPTPSPTTEPTPGATPTPSP